MTLKSPIVALLNFSEKWKIIAGHIVSHGFAHVEFRGANIFEIQRMLGVENLESIFFLGFNPKFDIYRSLVP